MLCSVNACLRVLGLLLVFSAASAGARAAEPALRLRLTAGRTTYDLADGGSALRQEVDDFRQEQAIATAARQLEGPEHIPRTPGGRPDVADLQRHEPRRHAPGAAGTTGPCSGNELKGPGAVVLIPSRQHTMELIFPRPTELAPRHTKAFKLTQLAYGRRNDERAYWTVPGRYTLTAFFETAVKPSATGAQGDKEKFGTIKLTSNPVTIDVRSAPGPRK